MAKPPWDVTCRAAIQHECGAGWSIVEQSGKAKVTRIYRDEGNKRVTRSKQLPIEWKATNSSKIQNAVIRLHNLIFERNISLAEAVRLDEAASVSDKPDAPETASEGWDVIAEDFLQTKQGRRSNTLKDLKLRVERTLMALEHKPMPIDGKSLMKKYAKLFFGKMKAGGDGRKRNLNDVSAFLKFAVQEKGKPTRYLPPQKSFIDELVGESETTRKAKLTPPLKPEQLSALLDQLESDGKHELHLAVGLVGLYGLRPAELAVLQVEEDKDKNLKLRVGQVKRNAKTMNQKKELRLVIPIDIDGRQGEAQRLLRLYHSELVKLPASLLKQIELVEEKKKFQDVGHEFGQLLKRYKPWKALVASNPDITPYSLRHGYAWRAHMCSPVPLPAKMAAASMGHTVIVHQKNYGSWIDESSMEKAFAMYQQGIASMQSQIVK
jgi:integrase